jgi:hypothetical protein
MLAFLDHTIAMLTFGMASTNAILIMIILSEALIARCLYLYKWSFMSRLNDDFVCRFLLLLHFLLFFLLLAPKYYLGELESNIHSAFFGGFIPTETSHHAYWILAL